MGTINISNSRGRDAVVTTESLASPLRVRWLDEKGRPAARARILKATVEREAEPLAKAAGGLDKLGPALVAGDPEVDLETYGSLLRDTSRVYIDPDRKIARRVEEWEVVRNPDRSERERRPTACARCLR
jgi:hypothetical protein